METSKYLLPLAFISIVNEATGTTENISLAQNKHVQKAKSYSKEKIKKKVIQVVSEVLGVYESQITDFASFSRKLGADAKEKEALISAFEKAFDVNISKSQSYSFRNVKRSVTVLDEIINTTVIGYRDIDFKGPTSYFKNDRTYSSLYTGNLSALTIPKGIKVILYSEVGFKGDRLIIYSKKHRLKISDLSKLSNNRLIKKYGDLDNWDNQMMSIEIINIRAGEEDPKEEIIFTRDKITQSLKVLVGEKLGYYPRRIRENHTFTDDLGADSLDIVEVVMDIEKEFGILIPDKVAEKIITVKDAVDVIYDLLNKTVTMYADKNFKGKVQKITNDVNSFKENDEVLNAGASSFIVPKGYRLILYSRTYFRGDKVVFSAKNEPLKVKNLAKIKSSDKIELGDIIKNWAGNFMSLKIERIEEVKP